MSTGVSHRTEFDDHDPSGLHSCFANYHLSKPSPIKNNHISFAVDNINIWGDIIENDLHLTVKNPEKEKFLTFPENT